MPDKGNILRKAIKRLRASGRTWQEIADKLGFKNPGHPCMIATGRWNPKPDRLEEMMRKLPRHLWQTTKEQETRVLSEIKDNHVGMKKAIKSRYLALQLGIEERMVRSCVNSLRKQGRPICSSVGKHSGFYWPASRNEYEAFKHRDYLSRIKDMQHVVDAMDMGAEAMFEGKPLVVMGQPELI